MSPPPCAWCGDPCAPANKPSEFDPAAGKTLIFHVRCYERYRADVGPLDVPETKSVHWKAANEKADAVARGDRKVGRHFGARGRLA